MSAAAKGLWIVAFLVGSSSVVADESRRAAADQVEQGNELMERSRYEEALSKYEEAEEKLPDAPEVAYNRGIALYRLGKFAEAESAFQDALKPERKDLEAASKYNLGRCAHASGLAKTVDPAAAVADLSRAVSFYDDALQIVKGDPDAAQNRAAAERLRAYLQKKLEEQKQQKQEPSPSSQPNEEPTSQPEEKPQSSQPSSQPASQPSQQQQGEEGQGQEDQEKQDREGQEQKQEKEDGSKDSAQPGDQSGGEDRPDPSQARQGDEQERKLTPEEAEPMLQEARDAERQRREARRQRMMRARGRIPVDKDW